MIPPLKTTVKMASTPAVLAMMGSRPRAAQPRKRAQEAVLVKNRMSQWSQNLQEEGHDLGSTQNGIPVLSWLLMPSGCRVWRQAWQTCRGTAFISMSCEPLSRQTAGRN